MKKSFLIVVAAFGLLSGCTKESEVLQGEGDPTAIRSGPPLSTQGEVTRDLVNFAAVADVRGCLGYNIRFSGRVEIRTQKIVKDGVIQTYVRQWSIKGLTATSWSTTSPSVGSPDPDGDGQIENYVVKAGTEMFAIQDPVTFSPIGMPTNPLLTSIFIHQGTIVLEKVGDPSDRLVIRHEIVKNPNSTTTAEMPRLGWYINGTRCGM